MPTVDTTQTRRPQVFWLFGLSGAGKSTLAARLATALRQDGIPVLELDGDAVRSGLCLGLGFSDSDRTENLRRSAEAARLALKSNLCVIASFITPLEAHRQLVTAIIGQDRLSRVFIDAPLDTCRARDVKGLYARAAAGSVFQMTGLTSQFERPGSCEFTVNTTGQNVDVCAARLLEYATRFLGKPPNAVLDAPEPGYPSSAASASRHVSNQ